MFLLTAFATYDSDMDLSVIHPMAESSDTRKCAAARAIAMATGLDNGWHWESIESTRKCVHLYHSNRLTMDI